MHGVAWEGGEIIIWVELEEGSLIRIYYVRNTYESIT